MCIYCMIGDHTWKYDPPFPLDFPTVPQPVRPYRKWDTKELTEYRDLLKEIRDLEEKVGCPCVPNKADYIGAIDAHLESRDD